MISLRWPGPIECREVGRIGHDGLHLGQERHQLRGPPAVAILDHVHDAAAQIRIGKDLAQPIGLLDTPRAARRAQAAPPAPDRERKRPLSWQSRHPAPHSLSSLQPWLGGRRLPRQQLPAPARRILSNCRNNLRG
jgi:hypothetical protein